MSSHLVRNKLLVVVFFIAFFLNACGSNDSNKPADVHTPQTTDEAENSDGSQHLPQQEPQQQPPKAAIKILPLGDSITQGGSGYASYRRELWFLLKDAAYNVDFIGSQDDFHGDVADNLKDFDLDHEGHWAWETGEIDAKLSGWLDDYQADIVLLHAGTNDFDRGQSNGSTIRELSSIIDKLRKNNPKVVILLAKIIPMKNKDTGSINVHIEALAKNENSDKSPVVIVDQYEGYAPLEENYDTYHPNRAGEGRIAKKWFDSLVPFLEN